MTKKEFLKNHWFNFPKPEGTRHTLEFTPKSDGNIESIQKIALNNAGNSTEIEMRYMLCQKLIIEKNYEFTIEDVQSINAIHEEYNRLY